MKIISLLLLASPGQSIDDAFDQVASATTANAAAVLSIDLRVAGLEASSGGELDVSQLITPECDIGCTLNAIQRDLPTGLTEASGTSVYIPEGLYTSSETVVLCRSMTIRGAGPKNTRIVFGERTGFWAPSRKGCRDRFGYGDPMAPVTGATPGGSWSTIKDMAIHGTGRAPTETTLFYTAGVHMESPLRLEDLEIRDFAQGVRVVADINALDVVHTSSTGWNHTATSNANLFTMHRVSIGNIRQHGLYTQGGDANQGGVYDLDVTGACQDGALYGPGCANIRLEALIGSQFYTIHSALACNRGDTQQCLNPYHQILSTHPASKNAFFGTYCEFSNGKAVSAPGDDVFGGPCLWEPESGMVVQAGKFSGFCVKDPSGSNTLGQEACFGDKAGTGVMAMQTETSTAYGAPFNASRAVRWKFGTCPNLVESGCLLRDVANFSGALIEGVRVTGDSFSELGNTIQYGRWTPSKCVASSSEYHFDGMAIEDDDGTGIGICRIP